MTKRKGDFIETYMGIAFYPEDPKTEEVNLTDIAHALSQTCRFNGHCKHFYSVAQHSINVCLELINMGHFNDFKILLYGILHDASEAYICDIPRPLKQKMEQYKVREKKLQKVIYQSFNLPEPTKEEKTIIKTADETLLHYEGKNLMPCKTWLQNIDVIGDFESGYIDPTFVKKDFINIVNYLLEKYKEQTK